MLANGVTCVGFAFEDNDTPQPAPYDVVAAWRFPNSEVVLGFEGAIEASGFHDYFDQVNLRGLLLDAEEGIRLLIDR